jgi:hypothetical protein
MLNSSRPSLAGIRGGGLPGNTVQSMSFKSL